MSAAYAFSRMRNGDMYTYLRVPTHLHYAVRFRETSLACRAQTPYETDPLLSRDAALRALMRDIYLPRQMLPRARRVIRAQRTGGRTALLETPPILLPLGIETAGSRMVGRQGDCGVQRFLAEIKGAGTEAENTGVDVPDDVPEERFITTYGEFFGKPWGAQREEHARHAMDASQVLPGRFPVRVVPIVSVQEYPRSAQQQAARISGLQRPPYALMQELRLMPSTVRGIYFDTADDRGLASLCERISLDPVVQDAARERVIDDVRGYLEIPALTSCETKRGYGWMAIGDIHLKWGAGGWDDAKTERYRRATNAWVYAKDVVIAPSGSWFVDLESSSTPRRYDRVADKRVMRRQQELYAMGVLRDFTRIASRMRVGTLLRQGEVPLRDRRDIARETLASIVAGVNRSALVRAEIRDDAVALTWESFGDGVVCEVALSELALHE